MVYRKQNGKSIIVACMSTSEVAIQYFERRTWITIEPYRHSCVSHILESAKFTVTDCELEDIRQLGMNAAAGQDRKGLSTLRWVIARTGT